MKIFAVICNGSAQGLQEALETFNPPSSCLYNEPIDPSTFRNAPFLIEVTDTFKPWLANQKSPWGLYLLAEKNTSFNEMRQHLRKYTYAKIPSEDIPVLFRFYDPRVFWNFASIIDNRNLHAMLGPIKIVASTYQEFKQDHFENRRAGYPPKSNLRGPFLTLTKEQEDAFNGITISNYKLKIYKHLLTLYQKNVTDHGYLDIPDNQLEKTLNSLAQSLFNFCIEEEIKDSRSIKMFADIILKHRIYQFDAIPSMWIEKLKYKANNNVGEIRMRMLINYIYGI